MASEPDFVKCLQSWDFEKDPFKETYDLVLWARPNDDIEKFKYYLSNSVRQKSLLNILLKGDYGSGKTYTLKFLKGYIEDQLNGIGIYFLIPKKYAAHGFRDVLTKFTKAVSVKKLEEIGKEIAEKNEITDPEIFINYLTEMTFDHDFSKAISNLVFNNEYAVTSAWLYAKTTAYQDKILKMEFSTKDESTIITVISNIIFLLSTRYPLVALLIDEIENLSGESIATRSIREGFRNLYDELLDKKSENSISIISAVTARAAYELQSSMGTALLDRISYDIPLSPLDDEQCNFFIESLFENSRKNRKKSLIPPFVDNDAIKLFIKKYSITKVLPSTSIGDIKTPRRLLKVGSFILNESCRKGEIINSQFIEKTLQLGEKK